MSDMLITLYIIPKEKKHVMNFYVIHLHVNPSTLMITHSKQAMNDFQTNDRSPIRYFSKENKILFMHKVSIDTG